MSQPSPTGYAMANEAMYWDVDEFLNLDAGLHSPATGHDMQGVGTGEDGTAPIKHTLSVAPGSHAFSPALAGNDKRNKQWLSDVTHGLPRCPSHQQLDQRDFHHAVALPPCLHGGRPDRAIAALDSTDDYPSNHVDQAAEDDTQNFGYLHEPDATQSGLGISSLSMLSASDGIGSELSSSASNAGTGPPPKALHIQSCACISCVEIGWFAHPMNYSYHMGRNHGPFFYQCRYPGCQEENHFTDITEHERSHFRVEHQYPCTEEHCPFTTKRWSDFKRHSSSKHCTSLKKPFNCPALWCKYSGDNGFARKDKLNNHVKTVHAGMSMPGKANQSIKPKVSDRV